MFEPAQSLSLQITIKFPLSSYILEKIKAKRFVAEIG